MLYLLRKFKIFIFFFLIFTQVGNEDVFAQSGLCDSITPFFFVNLAGNMSVKIEIEFQNENIVLYG